MGKLSPKQKRFADAYLDTGNGTQAVIDAKYDVKDRNSAKSVASNNLTKVDIIAYLQSHAEGASSRIVEMSKKARNEAVKLNANKDILDRVDIRPAENKNNIFVINLSEEQKENLRRLVSRNG